MFDAIKIMIAGIIGGLITYLEPLYNPITVLGYVFILDIVFGILVDIIVENDRIKIRKLLIAVAFLTMYFLVIASTYTIGERMDDAHEALYIVKILTYSFSYFYVANIIRNMRTLAPNSKPLAFLDYFLGLHVVKRLPDLARFLKLTNKGKAKSKAKPKKNNESNS
jgi:hypothetical protein